MFLGRAGRGLSLSCSFPNRLPEIRLGQAFPFLDALPGAVEQSPKAWGPPEQETFEIIVVVGSQQHGDGLAIPSDDDWALDATFVHIGTQPCFHVR
jgi:hypothetical protein